MKSLFATLVMVLLATTVYASNCNGVNPCNCTFPPVLDMSNTVAKATANVTVEDQREILPAPASNYHPFPLLNGRIGEFQVRRNAYMQQCKPNDTLVDVVDVEHGGIISSIRYRDLGKSVLEIAKKYHGDSRHLCYWVGFNESSNGGGIGGGATGAMSSGSNFMSTGASIVPGYNAATFDPKFFIEVDEVIPE